MFELSTFVENLDYEMFVVSFMHEDQACRERGLHHLIIDPETDKGDYGGNYCNVVFT
jgi:hypothetical protein